MLRSDPEQPGSLPFPLCSHFSGDGGYVGQGWDDIRVQIYSRV